MHDPTPAGEPSRAEQLARHMHNEISGRADFDQQDAGYRERAALAAEGALAELLPDPAEDDENFYVLPGLAGDGTAVVELGWGAQRAALATEDARLQAMWILEAAELADVEAALHAFMRTGAAGDDDKAAAIVQSFRRFRAAQAALAADAELKREET